MPNPALIRKLYQALDQLLNQAPTMDQLKKEEQDLLVQAASLKAALRRTYGPQGQEL